LAAAAARLPLVDEVIKSPDAPLLSTVLFISVSIVTAIYLCHRLNLDGVLYLASLLREARITNDSPGKRTLSLLLSFSL